MRLSDNGPHSWYSALFQKNPHNNSRNKNSPMSILCISHYVALLSWCLFHLIHCFNISFYYTSLCMCTHMHMHRCVCMRGRAPAQAAQKSPSDLLEPELQAVVICPVWVLETEFHLSIRAVYALDHGATSPVPWLFS